MEKIKEKSKFNEAKDIFFDSFGAFRIVNFLNKRDLKEKEFIIDSFDGGKIIDLGSGGSDGGFEFAYSINALTYVAVDISPQINLKKYEDYPLNKYQEKTDILSYLKNYIKNSEDSTITNFIISGIDKNIISDEKYIKEAVSEIKRISSEKSIILVICPDSIETKDKKIQISNLNVFAPELEKQGFRILLNMDEFTNFWILNKK